MVLCACTPISSQEPARVLKRNAASGDAIASTQILVHTREHVNLINKYGGRRGKFLLSLLCSRDLDKNRVFSRLPVLGWWIKIARIFLSARKLCRTFQVWKRSNFTYASSYFSCATVWKCSVPTADLLG